MKSQLPQKKSLKVFQLHKTYTAVQKSIKFNSECNILLPDTVLFGKVLTQIRGGWGVTKQNKILKMFLLI